MGLLDEERFPLKQKAKLGTNRPIRTIKLWIKRGLICRATNERVRLEAIYEGRHLVTSREAIKRFFARLNNLPVED